EATRPSTKLNIKILYCSKVVMASTPDITARPTPCLQKGVELYPYQTKVIEWMKARGKANPIYNRGISGGMVCLKMGLGKTFAALEHSLRSQSVKKELCPTLIVASKTVLYEWKNQGIEKFYQNIKALYFHKDFLGDYINHITAAEILEYNIVITTYDQCLSASRKHDAHKLVCEYGQEGIHKDKVIAIHVRKKPPYKPAVKGPVNLYQIPWNRIFLDESPRIANPKTYTFKAVMALYGQHKWCLTGTVFRNCDNDIWSQLRFCGYNTITTARLWRRWYFKDQNLQQYMYVSNYTEAKVTMPEKIEHIHYVDMDPDQKLTYQALLVETQDLYERMLMKFISYASVLAMFTRLRQVCISPYLIVAKSKNGIIQEGIDKALIQTKVDKWIADSEGSAGIDSPKIKKIIEIIQSVPKGEKIVIFSMFVKCLELVEKAIQTDLSNVSYEFLDGRCTGQERVDILTNFKEDPDVTVLLVHYKVGGEGINLPEGNHVLCIEPWWSPAVHNQGIARCWRRGQKKPVHVYWVITRKTIEQPILKMCANKDQLADFYLYGEEYNPQPTGLTKYEMQKLLGIAATM
ncbi:hypothetical protein LCGC14_1955090, partial [marine sediment metagenome]